MMPETMWSEVKTAPNKMFAEMWHDLFEGEGIPSWIMPEDGTLEMTADKTYKVYVPGDKVHLIEEILRKI